MIYIDDYFAEFVEFANVVDTVVNVDDVDRVGKYNIFIIFIIFIFFIPQVTGALSLKQSMITCKNNKTINYIMIYHSSHIYIDIVEQTCGVPRSIKGGFQNRSPLAF